MKIWFVLQFLPFYSQSKRNFNSSFRLVLKEVLILKSGYILYSRLGL